VDAVVPGAPSGAQDCRVDAPSVVNDMQPKLPWVILDLHFDLSRPGVLERIAQGLGGNLADFVLDERTEVPGFPFDTHPKLGTIRAAVIGC
jgi:hypothetical protein